MLSLEQKGRPRETPRHGRADRLMLKDHMERRNVISPFVIPVRKSNMAMSTMFSSRLPLL